MHEIDCRRRVWSLALADEEDPVAVVGSAVGVDDVWVWVDIFYLDQARGGASLARDIGRDFGEGDLLDDG